MRCSNRANSGVPQKIVESPQLHQGRFFLLSRSEFNRGEKLARRWRGLRRGIEAINDHVYQVEDLRDGTVMDVHATTLKLYTYAALDANTIMPHVLS